MRRHTIEEIFIIEPELLRLFSKIPSLINEPSKCVDRFCGNWSRIKMRFSQFVGWHAGNGDLIWDYDTVYQHFLAEAERCDTSKLEEDSEGDWYE